jgi:hypothetical protein
MKKLLDMSAQEAKAHFLKGSSYFNGDFPGYISFEPVLQEVASVLDGGFFAIHKSSNPELSVGVNYSFVANKDGRFAWRPYSGSQNLDRWVWNMIVMRVSVRS